MQCLIVKDIAIDLLTIIIYFLFTITIDKFTLQILTWLNALLIILLTSPLRDTCVIVYYIYR